MKDLEVAATHDTVNAHIRALEEQRGGLLTKRGQLNCNLNEIERRLAALRQVRDGLAEFLKSTEDRG